MKLYEYLGIKDFTKVMFEVRDHEYYCTYEERGWTESDTKKTRSFLAMSDSEQMDYSINWAENVAINEFADITLKEFKKYFGDMFDYVTPKLENENLPKIL